MVGVNGCMEAGSWHDELRPWASQTAQWLDVLPPHKPDNVHSSPGPHSRRTELSLLELSSDLEGPVRHGTCVHVLSHTSYTDNNNQF